jgi:bifunctional non-homologous end joining protein LigD
MPLAEYKKKRDFKKTPEPPAKMAKPLKALRFCVQKHRASHLHYDFRLELDGVLKSWAVPKGPSMNPQDKRLAMMVEDHPVDYMTFEGTIPKGEYGAGEVIVWDVGVYSSVETPDAAESRKKIKSGLFKGDIKIALLGKKLKGGFALVKIKNSDDKKDNAWLLIKEKDRYASAADITKKNTSVLSRKKL